MWFVSKQRCIRVAGLGLALILWLPLVGALGAAETEASALVGGGGGSPFSELAKSSSVLVGLDLGLGDLNEARIVRSIQAIYDSPNGNVRGKKFGGLAVEHLTIEAKPGYAIGAIEAWGGARLDGLSATFMRRRGSQLDRTDAYESRWLGGRGGSVHTKLGGSGHLVLGVHGRGGDDLDAFGIMIEK
ncbi:MAG TPA: hypothetical protein VFE24_17145 [Pirellulales bacterium]|jgi:hypothetical protein|nr:hypothetical protein [Pirellulales bacterium]